MSQGRRDIERLLSKDEHELFLQSKQPGLGEIEAAELSNLVTRLRDARDKAQTIAQRQRREMRGKAAPSGARAASDNSGSVEKSSLLAAAVQRVNKEAARRRSQEGKTDLVRSARRALRKKQAKPDQTAPRPASRTADDGMQLIPNEKRPTSGALDKEGQRPVLERSRKVR